MIRWGCPVVACEGLLWLINRDRGVMVIVYQCDRVLLVLVLGAAAGCAGTREAAPCRDLTALTPTETLMVMRGSAGEPMEVVLNDNPAGDAFLHSKSLPLRPGDPVVEHLLRRMHATLIEEQGVGIAAPQIGINRRAIWVKRLDIEPEQPLRPYLNIEIVSSSGERLEEWEGCLSIPAGFGKVWRAGSVTVAYDREDGTRAEEQIHGYTARIFQHEIDHLDGVLFIDRREPGAPLMPKEEYREMRRREKQAEDQAPEEPDGG